MFWSKFGFWFWVGFMIPFNVVLSALNIINDNMFMLALNIFTIMLSVFNAYQSHKMIKTEEEFRRWLDGKE